jgi:L-ascorbate metabolism protein UlaG (beta-lactamase superfamily)
MKEENTLLEQVQWLGHASIKITGEKVIYIDPYQIKGGEEADIILITHDHYDHLSLEDIEKVRADHTVTVVPASTSHVVPGKIEKVRPGDRVVVQGIEIEAVPAYNQSKPFHPREKQHVGYLFKVNDFTYYHTGDTDYIPEMKDIKTDVVFLPIGGTYTMTAEEAVQAVKDIQPKMAVPIHWGTIVGSEADALQFQTLCECEVKILDHKE